MYKTSLLWMLYNNYSVLFVSSAMTSPRDKLMFSVVVYIAFSYLANIRALAVILHWPAVF